MERLHSSLSVVEEEDIRVKNEFKCFVIIHLSVRFFHQSIRYEQYCQLHFFRFDFG